MGYSYYYNAPVMEVILGSLPWTVLLVGLAIVISTLAGIVLGIESDYRQGRPLDRALLGTLMFTSGFPDFFTGILLLFFFGVVLGLVPLDLQGIPGRMTHDVKGCPFHPRCTQKIEICTLETPETVATGQRIIACHRGDIVPLLEVKQVIILSTIKVLIMPLF